MGGRDVNPLSDEQWVSRDGPVVRRSAGKQTEDQGSNPLRLAFNCCGSLSVASECHPLAIG